MKMEGKYTTKNILMACLSKPPGLKKDIHAQLAETIAERRRIMEQWKSSSLSKDLNSRQNIHVQLKETIDELRRVMQLSGKLLSLLDNNRSLMENKQAA